MRKFTSLVFALIFITVLCVMTSSSIVSSQVNMLVDAKKHHKKDNSTDTVSNQVNSDTIQQKQLDKKKEKNNSTINNPNDIVSISIPSHNDVKTDHGKYKKQPVIPKHAVLTPSDCISSFHFDNKLKSCVMDNPHSLDKALIHHKNNQTKDNETNPNWKPKPMPTPNIKVGDNATKQNHKTISNIINKNFITNKITNPTPKVIVKQPTIVNKIVNTIQRPDLIHSFISSNILSSTPAQQLQPSFLLLLDTKQLCSQALDIQCVALQGQYATSNLQTVVVSGSWVISGTATNIGKNILNNVQVTASFFDNKGNVIDSFNTASNTANVGSSLGLTSLKPGASGDFVISTDHNNIKGNPVFMTLTYTADDTSKIQTVHHKHDVFNSGGVNY